MAGKRQNGRDQERFHAAMMAGAKMMAGGSGGVPRPDQYATEWKRFLDASTYMLSQAVPPFFSGILAVNSDCDVTRNYVEYNSLQSFTENSLLMSLVSFLYLSRVLNTHFKFGAGCLDTKILAWPGWNEFPWQRVDGVISAKFKGYLKNLRHQI